MDHGKVKGHTMGACKRHTKYRNSTQYIAHITKLIKERDIYIYIYTEHTHTHTHTCTIYIH